MEVTKINLSRYLKEKLNGKYIIYIAIHFLFAYTTKAQTEIGNRIINTVVIDPGHGGRDPGAIGKVSKEKDIALSIGLKLGKLINQRFPEVKVLYTRNDDRFIELYQRADIANKAKADLFISIHANSTAKQSPSGVEFWILGLHKADENLDVVKKENAALQFEQDVRKNYGFDPNSPEGAIIMTMKQNLFLDQSIQLAKLMEGRFVKEDNQLNRGTKQAGFIVLYKTSMPSVLVEVGFISNQDEEQYIANESGQSKIAANLANAFADYKLKYESGAIKQVAIKDEKKSTPVITSDNSEITERGFSKSSSSASIIVNPDDSKPIAEVVKKADINTAVPPKSTNNGGELDMRKRTLVIEDEEEDAIRSQSLPSTPTDVVSQKIESTKTSQTILTTPQIPTSANLEPKSNAKKIVTNEDIESNKKLKQAKTLPPLLEKYDKKLPNIKAVTKKSDVLGKDSVKKEIIDKLLKSSEFSSSSSSGVKMAVSPAPGKIKIEEDNSKIPSYVVDKDIKQEILDNTKRIDKGGSNVSGNLTAIKIESKTPKLPAVSSSTIASKTSPENKSSGSVLVFKVQIKAASLKISDKDPLRMKNPGLEESFENGLYKYLVGSFSEESQAQIQLEKIKSQGIKDAFIVKYKDGVRIK